MRETDPLDDIVPPRNPVTELPGVGETTADKLNEQGIRTVEDFYKSPTAASEVSEQYRGAAKRRARISAGDQVPSNRTKEFGSSLRGPTSPTDIGREADGEYARPETAPDVTPAPVARNNRNGRFGLDPFDLTSGGVGESVDLLGGGSSGVDSAPDTLPGGFERAEREETGAFSETIYRRESDISGVDEVVRVQEDDDNPQFNEVFTGMDTDDGMTARPFDQRSSSASSADSDPYEVATEAARSFDTGDDDDDDEPLFPNTGLSSGGVSAEDAGRTVDKDERDEIMSKSFGRRT